MLALARCGAACAGSLCSTRGLARSTVSSLSSQRKPVLAAGLTSTPSPRLPANYQETIEMLLELAPGAPHIEEGQKALHYRLWVTGVSGALCGSTKTPANMAGSQTFAGRALLVRAAARNLELHGRSASQCPTWLSSDTLYSKHGVESTWLRVSMCGGNTCGARCGRN